MRPLFWRFLFRNASVEPGIAQPPLRVPSLVSQDALEPEPARFRNAGAAPVALIAANLEAHRPQLPLGQLAKCLHALTHQPFPAAACPEPITELELRHAPVDVVKRPIADEFACRLVEEAVAQTLAGSEKFDGGAGIFLCVL